MNLRGLVVIFMLIAGTFSACQCSDKPDVGPVEEAATAVKLG